MMLALVCSLLAALQNPRASWGPPSPSEWKRPCLVEWQRSLDDAFALSKATGKPVLVCVNADAEAASESYAGHFYRDPEFAKLVAGYVPVIASVFRHTARDYDAQGKRIPCPRFGHVTCGEHVALEPVCYEKFFEKNRVAPRHIGVGGDGRKLFDCFLNFDVSPVTKALGAQASSKSTTMKAGAAIEARVGSRDSIDREAVEAAYASGEAPRKRALLEVCKQYASAEPFDLLRLGTRDPDPELRKIAREILAEKANGNAVLLVAEAIRSSRDAAERKLLYDALVRLSKGDARARTASTVYRALDAPSKKIDVTAWTKALGSTPTASKPLDADDLEKEIGELQAQSHASPKDKEAPLKLARAMIAFAEDRMRQRKDPTLLLADAKKALGEAEKRGAPAWATEAILARLAFYAGDREEAEKHAAASVGGVVAVATSPDAAAVLGLFAGTQGGAIVKANDAVKEWPAELLSDAHAAYRILELHPLGTAEQAAAHVDLLNLVGVPGLAAEILEASLRRFPESAPLHERFRARVLEDRGLEGLEAAYDALLKADPSIPGLRWFSGYASLVAAEFLKRKGDDRGAIEAYGRAIDSFEKSAAANADYRDTSDHYVTLALAGRGRVRADTDDYEKAIEDVTAAVSRRAESLESDDGLLHTPLENLRAVRAALESAGKKELAAKLEESVAKIDPELLKKPEPPQTQPGK